MSRLRIATVKAGRQEPPLLTMDLPLCLRHSHKNMSLSRGPATSARACYAGPAKFTIITDGNNLFATSGPRSPARQRPAPKSNRITPLLH
jgi:hypothetical protein